MKETKIAIVASNASTRFGGESFIPYHIYKRLHQRGLTVKLLVHERCRNDLQQTLTSAQFQDVLFFKDTSLQKALHFFSKYLPNRVSDFTTNWLIDLITETDYKKTLKKLIQSKTVNLIHQCSKVSPRLPSMLYDLPAPCIIGPLNGNMSDPPGLRSRVSFFEKSFIWFSRLVSNGLNRLMPGKLQASVILVANQRTREGLPKAIKGQIVELVENGVDLQVWSSAGKKKENTSNHLNYVSCGAFIDYKAFDLLLYAFQRVRQQTNIHLTLIGDGPLKLDMIKLADQLCLNDSVTFTGALAQSKITEIYKSTDVFVFPSLRDCGGAAILEAMAMELPVIAADWGGPKDYVTSESGILVPPTSKETYVEGLSTAMLHLAEKPKLRKQMGLKGRERVLQSFDWERKIDRLIEIYTQVASEAGSQKPEFSGF